MLPWRAGVYHCNSPLPPCCPSLDVREKILILFSLYPINDVKQRRFVLFGFLRRLLKKKMMPWRFHPLSFLCVIFYSNTSERGASTGGPNIIIIPLL
jgi:hypothetical protein